MSGVPKPGARKASYSHLRRTRDPDWLKRAACIGSPIEFVPLPNDVRSELRAKAVCATCGVQTECLDDALTTDAAGVRGGRSETERRWMKRRRLA